MLYDRNIGPSSKIFSYLWQSSENIRTPLSSPWKYFGIFANVQKVVGNLRKIIKTSLSVCLYKKKNITCSLVDMNFIFSSYQLKDKIHIHIQACNILYIFCFFEIHVNNVLLLVIQEVPNATELSLNVCIETRSLQKHSFCKCYMKTLHFKVSHSQKFSL